ncbi:MAG: hypothetical protein M1335_02330, partial [Chloroflexi bacterium]|nr:hypothetical protein [Chloroflexota bacterium]
MESSAEQQMVEVIQEQLGEWFSHLAVADRTRYAAMLDSIRKPTDVALDSVERGHTQWTITICSADFPGALSLIVGLLTAYRLDIPRADIFTLSFPERRSERPARRPLPGRRPAAITPTAPTRRLLDVFEVRALSDPAPDLWQTFQADLAALLAAESRDDARDDITGRVSEAFRALGIQEGKLFPMSVD